METEQEITLRDHLAGLVMQELFRAAIEKKRGPFGIFISWETLSKFMENEMPQWAYKIADAMIKARDK